MKKFIFLLLLALVTIILLLFIINPGLLDNIWLWIIGFMGGIIGLIRNFYDQIVQFINRTDEKELAPAVASIPTELSKSANTNIQVESLPLVESIIHKIESKQSVQLGNTPFSGTTLTVLRYIDDGDTTLGLLYIRDKFFAYTLEDTCHNDKIAKETRIPSGEYTIDFLKQNTGLTLKYQEKFSWFKYHLQLMYVPNFSGVYIHIGNNKEDTAGCILIADGVNASTVQKSIMYSTKAYKRFYMQMKSLINTGEKIRIVIHDENWFSQNKLNYINNS